MTPRDEAERPKRRAYNEDDDDDEDGEGEREEERQREREYEERRRRALAEEAKAATAAVVANPFVRVKVLSLERNRRDLYVKFNAEVSWGFSLVVVLLVGLSGW